METKETPHGIVAYDFAQALVQGRYSDARDLLCADLKVEYAVEDLKQNYEEMIEYAQPVGNVLVDVMDNTLLGHSEMDAKGWAYAAIHGDCWSEAVTVTIAPFAASFLIKELIWGRP